MSVIGFSLTEPENKRAKRTNTSTTTTTSGLTPNTKALLQTDPAAFGLTLYEVHRLPRTPVSDETTSTIQIRNLNIELTCPVCLGILHTTHTIMECLHRFCYGCISKSLRLGKKECPTCRVKCPSMRYLRPDPNYDGLIAQIYPNLEEYEAKQESIIEEINKHTMKNQAFQESMEQGKKRQAMAKSSRTKREYSDVMTPPQKKKDAAKPKTPKSSERKKSSPVATSPQPRAPVVSNLSDTEISFVLMRHPEEKNLTQLANKYLRTSRQLTIRHLKKFLGKKLNQDESTPLMVALSSTPYKPLNGDLTLDQIEKEVGGEELTLFYQVAASDDQHAEICTDS